MGDVLQMFPTLDPATEAALRASIERFGVIVPATVDQNGRTIDGHHRQRIAAELGIECPTTSITVENDEQAGLIARTLNDDRRQRLDPEQRREQAAVLRAQGHSLRAIAAALGETLGMVQRDLSTVSPDTVPDRIVGRDGKSRPSSRPVDDPAEWVCLACGEGFAVEVWECPGCQHHWALDDDECRNCHDFERNPNGDIAYVGPSDEPQEETPPITKPDLGGGLSHPARFSEPLFEHFREMLAGFTTVLDPFAGTGRIHELRPDWETTGVELEPEWAILSPHTLVGNALAMPFEDGSFDAICTSPTYGNRLADHHNAVDPHLRRSYTHDLGRQLHEASSGAMHWGDEYREFHQRAWKESDRVLRSGGRFIINIKDHIRGGEWQDVAVWHLVALLDMGYRLAYDRAVPTSSLRQGANGELRVIGEHVFALDKP